MWIVGLIALMIWVAITMYRSNARLDKEAREEPLEIQTPRRFKSRDHRLLTRARTRGAVIRFKDNPKRR